MPWPIDYREICGFNWSALRGTICSQGKRKKISQSVRLIIDHPVENTKQSLIGCFCLSIPLRLDSTSYGHCYNHHAMLGSQSTYISEKCNYQITGDLLSHFKRLNAQDCRQMTLSSMKLATVTALARLGAIALTT